MAATLPDLPLDLGEFVEVVLRGTLRDPLDERGWRQRFERFLGKRLSRSRWVVLTNRRLLLLRGRDPARYAAGEWFDAAFDRRNLRAGAPVTEGDLVVMPLNTRRGVETLVVAASAYKEAVRLARALGT